MDDLAALIRDHGPLQAEEAERAALGALERVLSRGSDSGLAVAAGGEQVELPETARRLLRAIVRGLARGEAIKVVPYQPMVSILALADLLNVSIAEAERLLDDGELPIAETEGEIRRVRFQDVMAYKERRDAERREGLTQLIRMSEELGLYDEDDVPGPSRREHANEAAPTR
jgi:excisionase family DNA binding protein